jgi:hypothetical protein
VTVTPIRALYLGSPTPAARTSLDRLVARPLVDGVILIDDEPGSSAAVERVLAEASSPWLLQLASPHEVDVVPRAVGRMLAAAQATGAALVYGDYLDGDGDALTAHPLADHQPGSVGDHFDFGPLRLWSVDLLRAAIAERGLLPDLKWHGWYDLRLKATGAGPAVRLPEPLCTVRQAEQRATGVAVFDYLLVGREAQVEAERVATEHLRVIGALVGPSFAPFEPVGDYPVEASVVVPVRDRVKTVADAVRSALSQQTDFAFNVIVVDNHSSDGTTELLAAIADDDPRLIHVTPKRRDLGIGGCWNEAVFHPACGRWACQLDSDDLYSGDDVLARVVAKLREGCGMVIGSYSTVDIELNPLPPGLIDHAEWTDDNGPNNALRINGLGAPRCFATELVRRDPFPNVSYGEDYAVALRVCREYRVGRIWDSLYWCRRWEDNTDAALSATAVAKHQVFKDRIRTLEIAARQRLNEADEAGS